jgi:simple sugar transport system ATP-binding protein
VPGEVGRAAPLLELDAVSKHFGAIQALADVSLALHPGEVVGLMGDNGAGKSTLVRIVAGNYPPSAGTMTMQGRPVAFHRPTDARAAGIEIVYQDLALCDNLSAAENVFLGRELVRSFGPVRVLDYAAMFRRAGELFAELKSETRPRDLVRRMSGGQRQAVAIARTRLADPKIVLMDEPTAAISVRQVAEVLALIRRLREHGIAVVLISHRMPDVFAVADRIVVMRRGSKVADKPVGASSPEEVTGLITGAIEAA